MIIKLAEPELEVEIAPSKQRVRPRFKPDSHAAGASKQDRLPNTTSQEYRLLYLPTMLGVYTARHQEMPMSNESLRDHVFGTVGHPCCEACREETEFLVAHQKRFF